MTKYDNDGMAHHSDDTEEMDTEDIYTAGYKEDYGDIAEVLLLVSDAQDAEQDRREMVKEAKRFITDRDGQWDQESQTKMTGRYRGQFDMCTPIVDGIAGEIEKADFSLRVTPSAGSSDMDTAKTFDGIIRNIRNISDAENVFNRAGRSMVVGGFDAWEVKQQHRAGDSFDQDLMIKYIPNAMDSVWIDMASVEQDGSDANWGVKLVSMPFANYRRRWPEGSTVSVGDNAQHEDKDSAKSVVVVGKLYYKKYTTVNLVQMNDGSVYRDDGDFQTLRDELALKGILVELDSEGEEKRRTREICRIWTRLFNGADWLQEEEETVFDWVPLVVVYGCYDILEDERIYCGKIENLYSQQRALNFATSRDIEDGALSPSAATWMTDDQAEGNDYSEMNTDHVPVRIYNADPNPNVPPPFPLQGPQVNAGLQTTMANMQQMLTASSNTFDAQQGNASSTQSGIAGSQQIEQGNIGNLKWFKAMEVAICYTGKLLIAAIPRVYDSTQQTRLVAEDGSTSMASLNTQMYDAQTNELVTINDLALGDYDVVCEMGPAFSSAQKEASRSFEALAAINPGLADRGMDIWLKNKKEPGMDLMAERERTRLMAAGEIPESQWTDEEKEQIALDKQNAANNPPPPDPAMLLVQAEQTKADAEMLNAQNKQELDKMTMQLKMRELEIKEQEIQLDAQKFQFSQQASQNVEAAKIDQGQQKIDQSGQKIALDAQNAAQKNQLAASGQQFDQANAMIGNQQGQEVIDLKTAQQQFDQMSATIAEQQKQLTDAAEMIAKLGDEDQFDYDPDTQELTQRG